MSSEVANTKRALRAELRERRRLITPRERESAAETLTGFLIELATSLEAGSVSAYLSTNEEPNTRGFLSWALENNITVYLPISREDGLLDWVTFDGTDEELDLLGMPTPSGELLGPIAINDVDLILVPAAAIDRTGMRMGWGRGYFDKTLGSMERRPPVYAVVFGSEFVDSVPSEVHDQRVDGVVTPLGITTFTAV